MANRPAPMNSEENMPVPMNSEANIDEGKKRPILAGSLPSEYYYGTFQGVANYNPLHPHPLPHTAIGFTSPPPSLPPYDPRSSFPGHGYRSCQGAVYNFFHHSPGYQAIPVQAYAVVDGGQIREDRLPCCGLGMGWFMFILGFFLSGIPWYVAALVMLCTPIDYREKPGYVACTVAAVLCTIALTIGATRGAHSA